MITQGDIEKLAKLSRIALTDDEKAQFGKEIESILGYVSEIQEVSKNVEQQATFDVKNIVRDDTIVDTDPKNLIESAPESQGDFITVKKIIA